MKKNYLFLLILAVVFGFIFTQIFDSKIDLNGDNAHYLQLAQNISKGLGYTHNTPDGVLPSNHYPPGYSAFLAVFMWLGVSMHNMVFFKVLNGILLFVSFAGLFYIVNRITKNTSLAFVSVLLSYFSPKLLEFSTMVMSEMFFIACSVVFFVSLYEYSRRGNHKKFWTSPYFYISIVSAVISYYTRSVGAALVFALLVFFLFRKEWIQAVASLVGVVLLVMPWSIRNAYHGIESRYFDTIMTVNPWRPESGTISSVGEMVDKILVNFDESIVKGFQDTLFPFISVDYTAPSGVFQIIVGLLILAVIFYGAWKMGALKWTFIAYLIAQIGLLLLWHSGSGSRYVVPIAPFLFITFYSGLYHLIRLVWKQENKFSYNLSYAFLILLFFMYPPVELQAKIAKQPLPPAYKNYFSLAKEMQKQLPENTICCCRKPELFTFYAPNLYAVNYKFTSDMNELLKDLVQKKVEYVILEQLGFGSTGSYLYPAIVEHAELFQVYGQLPNPDTYLLKFDSQQAIEKLGVIISD